MAPNPKSIYRQPGVQHFQLVHRSQRDPLINDPEASQHVLKAFTRGNDERKGRTKAQLEATLSEEVTTASRENEGEASLYGIYYDDTEYDYMQHLRQAGIQEEGVDSMWLEAPSTSTSKQPKGKGKALQLKDDLPPEALPSTTELPMSSILAAHQSVPAGIAGLQPDMDPHLRQALEALEDDAFIDEALEDGEDGDDFFGQLVQDGELEEGEELDFEFQEWGADEGEEALEIEQNHDDGWEARFAKFQIDRKSKSRAEGDADSVEGISEIADTIGTLPKLAVIGGKRRRTGTTDGSGFSLSSSAVYRSEGLTTLDQRFETLMSKEYDIDEDEDEDEGSAEEDTKQLADADSDDDSEALQLFDRADFGNLMDEFLDNYELVGGRKLRPTLEGDTGAQKLETLRGAMGLEKDHLEAILERQAKEEAEGPAEIPMPVDLDEKHDRWDCETILSTYSNLENHPKIIRAREVTSQKKGPKIRLHPKTGLPIVEEEKIPSSRRQVSYPDEDDTDESDVGSQVPGKAAVGRPLNESKEDKKARKKAVKEDKQERRKEKKEKKEMFAAERKHQKNVMFKIPLPVKPL